MKNIEIDSGYIIHIGEREIFCSSLTTLARKMGVSYGYLRVSLFKEQCNLKICTEVKEIEYYEKGKLVQRTINKAYDEHFVQYHVERGFDLWG